MHTVLGDKRAVAILLGPAFALYTATMLVPVVWSFVYSFYHGNVITGFHFVGLNNFQRLFTDDSVVVGLKFTLKYSLVITIGQIVVGYGLALLYLFVLRRASTFVRTMVFFPVVLPTVAVALFFAKLFQISPQEGPVSAGLGAIGIGPSDWFATGSSAFWVIVCMDLWRTMGFYAVILYTGLVDIPDDVLEAARLDGASGWRLVKHIVVPLSFPILWSAVILAVNASFKVFDTVLALTNGGPGNATTPLTLYMFQTSFLFTDYGYGATLAVLISLLSFIVTLSIFRSSRRDVTGS
jgi:raffinose/stachyose/melibiose transport system permease protein